MKIPSINYLLKNGRDSLLRFPIILLFAMLVAGIGIFLVNYQSKIDQILPLINVMLTFTIGIPLMLCIKLCCEIYALSRRNVVFIHGLGFIILLGIYLSLPNQNSTHNTAMPYIKYAIYTLIAHLLVATLPVFRLYGTIGFWHYNRILFQRLVVSVFFSAVLFWGISMALMALHLLFEVKIAEELYFSIWIFLAAFISVWFFVSGIPSDFSQLDSIDDFPRGLKIFAQYILFSLLCLYLIILYAYAAKIVLAWDWPKGLVSYLIICVAVLGVSTFLLLLPYGLQKENSWIKKANFGFYLLLIPLLVMLFVAIFMRIGDYGITLKRYLIIVFGIWLVLITLYFLLKSSNVKFIFISLASILFLISFGPWGAFSVSERSQVNRLKAILESSGILVDGKVKNEPVWKLDSLKHYNLSSDCVNDKLLVDSVHNEVLSIVNYLDDFHGFKSIRGWYSQNIDAIVTNDTVGGSGLSEASAYMQSLGLSYSSKFTDDNISYVTFNSDAKDGVLKVSGFDYVVTFDRYLRSDTAGLITEFHIDTLDNRLVYSKYSLSNKIIFSHGKDTHEFDLLSLFNDLDKEYGREDSFEIPQQKMTLSGKVKTYEFQIHFKQLRYRLEADTPKIESLNGSLLIKKLN